MNKSENINELADALSRFQAKVVSVLEANDNPFLGSKYADLASILQAVRPAMAEEGLSVAQVLVPPSQQGHCAVETVLMHKSGQWMSGVLEMPALPNKGLSLAQGVGSAITYCRRYALAAMLCIAQTDDDGKGVTHDTGEGPEKIDSAQLNSLKKIVTQKNRPELVSKICAYFGIEGLDDLPAAQYQSCIEMLQKTKAKKEAGNATA